MGNTGRKDFSSALGGMSPEQQHKVSIGDHDQNAECKSHQKPEEDQGKFIGMCAGATESEQGGRSQKKCVMRQGLQNSGRAVRMV